MCKLASFSLFGGLFFLQFLSCACSKWADREAGVILGGQFGALQVEGGSRMKFCSPRVIVVYVDKAL